MTGALAILEDIRRCGGDVSLVPPDRLRVSAPPARLSEFTARVRALKPDLLAVLARSGDPHPDESWDAMDWKAYFDERAAIAEYDGGLTRTQAEELAFRDMIGAMQGGSHIGWPPALVKLGIAPPSAPRV
jgi:hypothetical protein